VSRAGLVVPFLALMFSQSFSLAGGLREFVDSWPIDSQTARRVLDLSEKTDLSGLGFQVMAGQGRLFEMPELNQRFLSIEGDITRKILALRLAVLWERTGSELFVEDHLGGRILAGESPSWGIAAAWKRQIIGNLPQKSLLEWDLLWELGFGLGEIKGRLNLRWPLKVSQEQPGGRRRRNLLNITMVKKELAGALVVDRHDDGTPRAGFHLLLVLDRGIGLEFRADPATGSLGPGLSLVRGGFLLRTSHVIHPHLGVTHRLLLVVGQAGGGV